MQNTKFLGWRYRCPDWLKTKSEAWEGIEPSHRGFADRSVSTSPPGLKASILYPSWPCCSKKSFLLHLELTKKLLPVFGIIVLVLAAVAAVYFVIAYTKPKAAGIYITSNPTATVYIDGQQVGKTPYDATRKPGEIVVKLIPISTGKPLVSFETKVTLSPDIQTVIRRDFGESDDTSAGEVTSFVGVGGKDAQIAIISIPDAATVTIDGQKVGYAPFKDSAVSPGDHQINVAATGFFERTFWAKAIAGYKLTVVVKLAKNSANQISEKPKETPKPMVKILDTPTGFLRVRVAPKTDADEVGLVKPGDTFVLLGEDKDSGWFQIEYQKGKSGWISNQFAQKLETNPSGSPTPTATSSATPV